MHVWDGTIFFLYCFKNKRSHYSALNRSQWNALVPPNFIAQGIILLSKSLCVSLLLTVVIFQESFFHMYLLRWPRLLAINIIKYHYSAQFSLTPTNKLQCKPVHLSLPFSAKYIIFAANYPLLSVLELVFVANVRVLKKLIGKFSHASRDALAAAVKTTTTSYFTC